MRLQATRACRQASRLNAHEDMRLCKFSPGFCGSDVACIHGSTTWQHLAAHATFAWLDALRSLAIVVTSRRQVSAICPSRPRPDLTCRPPTVCPAQERVNLLASPCTHIHKELATTPQPSAADRSRCRRTTPLISLFLLWIWPEKLPRSLAVPPPAPAHVTR